MTKRKKMRIAVISASILLIAAFVLFYCYSYVYWYEGRNTEQNNMAKGIYLSAESALAYLEEEGEVGIAMPDNAIISTAEKFEVNTDIDSRFYDEMSQISSLNDIDYENGSCYIEIRNGEVYRVLYAKWNYSGFTGCYPDYNTSCTSFMTLANQAYEEFLEYCGLNNIIVNEE